MTPRQNASKNRADFFKTISIYNSLKYKLAKPIFLLVLVGLLSSCGAKKGFHLPTRSPQVEASSKEAAKIVDYALGYLGTDYKYGGTSKRGVDCSGLIYTSFLNAADILLPRTSRAMAQKGQQLLKSEVRVGDLLFFKTNPRRNVINHVGLVVEVKPGKISFIHATTHGGVIISNLHQKYWKRAYTQARRVL